MIGAIWAALGVLVLFVALPAAAVTTYLFSRKNFPDFDQNPERLKGSTYEAWAEEILRDMAWMREQTFEPVHLTAYDGTPLLGEWRNAGSAKTVILSHGYRTTPLNNFSTIGREFIRRGWNVLMIWQRGQGKSGGRVTAFGLRERYDLLEWVDWVQKKAGGEIVLYGISMGGAAVGYASDAQMPECVKGMVLDCAYCRPYDQMLSMAQSGMKASMLLLPLINAYARWLLKVDMTKDIRDSLRQTRIPALFLSGMKDDTVRPEAVRAGYEACASRKELLLVPGATHTLAFLEGGAELQAKVFEFLNEGMTR